MSNIVNLGLHRKMRELQKNVDDIAAGRTPRIVMRGRGQGKTMNPDEITTMMHTYLKSPGVPVWVGGHDDLGSGVREMQEETGLDLSLGSERPFSFTLPKDESEPWYSLRGRAQDMRAQLPTAQVLEFKQPTTTP